MNMSQVRTQFGELSFDIEASAIPLDQGARSKSVS